MRVRLAEGIGRDLEVVVTSTGGFDSEDERWFRELEADIEQRFGLQVRVGPRDAGEWLLELD